MTIDDSGPSFLPDSRGQYGRSDGPVKLVPVDSERPDPNIIARAAKILIDGGLVVFPTETVYGLGGNALDEAALERIFAAKQRPRNNPLIAHCRDVGAAMAMAAEWPEDASRLAEHFWPGPLTLVVRKADVPDLLTANLGSVALRVPRHPVAQALLAAVPFPIAAPSANRYTQISPTAGEHIDDRMSDAAGMVLDAGPSEMGIESTVVDLTSDRPVLLRPGSVTRAELEAVVGPILLASAVADDAPRPSPGMARKHYAPKAELRIVRGKDLAHQMDLLEGRGVKFGAIVHSAQFERLTGAVLVGSDPVAYARGLYASLHQMDRLERDVILAEALPADSAWDAVRDRLTRAAHAD